MSNEENGSNEDISVDQLKESLAQKDSVVTDLQGQLDALKSKTNELLGETKAAKQKAKDESAAAQLAQLDKAKKNGDFEQMLKSSEEARTNLSTQLEQLQGKVSSEKTKNAAMKIASMMADGSNADILSDYIGKRLKYTDDGVKVLDAAGNLTVSSLEDLKAEFESGDKYKSLLRGNKSSGGSATGSGSSASGMTELTRADFDKLNSVQKMEFIRVKGGKVID